MSNQVIRTARKVVSAVNLPLSTRIMYRALMKKKLDLKDPKGFNEKICWLKLYAYPDDELVRRCADKYQVHNYLREKGLETLSVSLLGVWDKPEDIVWESLPEKFVLKCNHGAAYNIICTDKTKLNKELAVLQLNKWLKEDFGLVSGERHYSKMKRKVICETFIEGELKDYKFFCFNGEPRFYYVADVPDGDFHKMTCDFFMPDGSTAPFSRKDHKPAAVKPRVPDNIDEMLRAARILSAGLPFVRVDFMMADGKLYLSEMTFTPSAGMMPFEPDSADNMIGEWLDLSSWMK